MGSNAYHVLRRLLTPLAIIPVVLTMRFLIADQVIVYGFFAKIVEAAMMMVIYVAAAWVFWRVASELVEWIISSPKIPDEGLDAGLLRLAARVIGFVGGVLILAYGANELGIPILGVAAGLGVGGLAVALAIRPTLENLIGGFILYADRPVSVGDFCSFGTNVGTVEKIGVRSTQIRALDRTLISIPNATFADMEIVNWAKCDRMQILATIGLRYETGPDQLRYVLAKLREMFLAHPRIDKNTVRVRFVGYGASSLDVEIRVYALTRDWNDLFAIREDVFLRVIEIVAESGTGFAFPSQTLYLGRDEGLDKERSDAAEQQVQSWRRTGQLPFPNTARAHREKIADSLDYPPHGSPEARDPKTSVTEEAEPLSKESESKSP
jgi:MscS family membrane protein